MQPSTAIGTATASGSVVGTLAGHERDVPFRPDPDDPVAAGAVKAILEAGLRVPEDIAIIGAGNVHYSDLLRVPLSTIDQSSAAIGEKKPPIVMSQRGDQSELPEHTPLNSMWAGGERNDSSTTPSAASDAIVRPSCSPLRALSKISDLGGGITRHFHADANFADFRGGPGFRHFHLPKAAAYPVSLLTETSARARR